MEYSSSPYAGMAQEKKMATTSNVYKNDTYVQKSVVGVVISFYVHYQSFSCVFIRNKTIHAA